jgi:Flp pilus assembly protein CpaB
MDKKSDILPIVIASAIALLITGVFRFLMPGNLTNEPKGATKEIPMPDIPLLVKEVKKLADVQVLIVTRNIKKGEKIVPDSVTWKKWPHDAMQPYFIAKDDKGSALNNASDHTEALKMWAVSEIQAGIPLSMHILTSEDPKKKEAEEAKKKQEEEKKKQEEKKKRKEKPLIKKGRRAVTFSVDQRSTVASSLIKPGDIVDILIMEPKGDKIKTHKYKALKTLAIDGVTKLEEEKKNKDGTSLNSFNVSGILSPKNVTLEIKEEMVEPMIKQSMSNGILLLIRPQNETSKVTDEEYGKEENDDQGDPDTNKTLLRNMMNMGNANSAEKMLEIKNKKEEEARSLSMLINNMNYLNRNAARGDEYGDNGADASASGGAVGNLQSGKKSKSGRMEFVSGKTIGKDTLKEDYGKVILYRKLKSSETLFDKKGVKVDAQSASGGSSDSGDYSSGGSSNRSGT